MSVMSAMSVMSTFEQLFVWVALPYACFLLLVAGLVWRWRTDQFGWTSRSSQWNESRILRWASPLFHFGILFVAVGHVMGLGVPKSFTEAAGVPEHVYHLMAVIPGTIAGVTYSLISTTMESCFLPKIQKSKFLEKTSKGRYGEIKFHRELG